MIKAGSMVQYIEHCVHDVDEDTRYFNIGEVYIVQDVDYVNKRIYGYYINDSYAFTYQVKHALLNTKLSQLLYPNHILTADGKYLTLNESNS